MRDNEQDELDDAMLQMSEEEMLREIRESQADIAAGRVVSGEEVLAMLQRMIDDHLAARAGGNGNPIK